MTFALAGVTLSGMAWKRTDAEMQKIARETLDLRGNATTGTPVVRLLEKEMLSVYGRETGGYVVVSRSGASTVIGYSDERFDASEMPDGLRWWLDRANAGLAEGENAVSRKKTAARAVAPLLKTTWAQESPYNQLCPQVGGGFWGSTTPMTGCVATAMAQVMNYFQYPAASTGMGAYSTDGQRFTPAATKTTFQWDKMRNSYGYGYTQDEAKAVAELMRDCGYASRMVYTANGSGANIYDAAYGLSHNMQYDSLAMRVRTRAYYRDDQWVDMVQTELTAGRPILYMAVDPEKLGHSFVFDGLDEKGFVHVNWGWSGTANGYFDISTVSGLTPSYQEPYYGTTVKYDFYDEQAMVVGFRPQATPDKNEKYESTFVTYEMPQITIDDDIVYISQIPLFNYSHLTFHGLLGMVVEGEDGHAVVLPFFYSPWENDVTIPVLGGVYFTEEFYPSGTLNETDFVTPRPDGKYRLYFVSWASKEMEQGTNPQMIRYPMALARDGKENYCVWEASIKGGHWDAASLRMVEDDVETSGIVLPTDFELDSDTAVVFDLEGRLLYCGRNPEGNVEKGVPVIVRRGSKAEKVIF